MSRVGLPGEILVDLCKGQVRRQRCQLESVFVPPERDVIPVRIESHALDATGHGMSFLCGAKPLKGSAGDEADGPAQPRACLDAAGDTGYMARRIEPLVTAEELRPHLRPHEVGMVPRERRRVEAIQIAFGNEALFLKILVLLGAGDGAQDIE